MELWSTLTEYYNDAMENRSDPRVKDWFLMSGPLPVTILVITYAYFVKVIGPKLMENRQPFVLRRFMIYYNLFQVLLSAWIFCMCLKYGWWNDYSYRCQPVDYSDNPRALKAATYCWVYFMSKFTEWIDTFIFILRKKNNQISNLHVYHHASMPFVVWWGVKLVPGGHTTFLGFLNTFTHIIMYGYYSLAALGPKMQPYLWWKKYLTTLQIIQFVLIIVHASQLFFIECDFPVRFAWWILANTIVFLYMFGRFYMEAYAVKGNKKLPSSSNINSKQQ